MEHAGWAPPDSDLLAYLMDDLEGARAEYLAVHLRHCPHCRARLDELRETLGLLQTMTAPGPDDSAHRAALKARIAAAAQADAVPARSGGWRFAPAGVAFAALLVLVVVSGPMIARAGVVSLNDILRVVPGLGRDNAPQVISDDYGGPPGERAGLPDGPTVDPAALAFAPLVPEALPGNNHLAATAATADGLFHAIYSGPDGLELLVVQQPAFGASVETAEPGVVEQVDDINVVVYSLDVIDGVIRLTWVHHDVLFIVDAVRAAPGAFSPSEARAVVSFLIHLRDSAHVPPL